VLAGTAEVRIDDETGEVPAGGVALVPKDHPHEVRNAAQELLRIVAVYAEPDGVTSYRAVVQPDGSHDRHTVS